jgi:hypothetical protein
MSETYIREITNIIDTLKKSPLFNLSLTSRELFHSNFLAWLAETYPREVGQVFSSLIAKGIYN